MSLRELPARPSLEHLKNQARSLLNERLADDAAAIQRFAAFGIDALQPKLADALHVLAREYGFPTWPALKQQVELASENPLEVLVAAIKANDAGHLREVLARYPSLQARINEPLPNYGFDEPALLAAVHKQNRDMVDALLDVGAHINERSRWWAGGFGALDLASAELSTHLIARGAYVDLHAAARLGQLDHVRDLLAANPALLQARGGDGQFPLHFASTVDVASFLLDAGADLEARDLDHESTALQYMVSTKPHRHDVARYLLTRGAEADILAASALGDLPLVERLLNDDPETVRITVSERSFPKRDPRSGGSIYIYGFGLTRSPHMIAHEFGHTAVFNLLMQRSAPWLRLVQAAELGDEPLAQQLLQQHPMLFSRLTTNAARRLVGVAVRNNTRAAKLLLQAGWPANVALENGQTPLHYAAWHGNLAAVQALLSRNAPVNVFETEHGGSPLAWALHGSLHSWERARGNYPAVAEALLAAGATLPQKPTSRRSLRRRS